LPWEKFYCYSLFFIDDERPTKRPHTDSEMLEEETAVISGDGSGTDNNGV